MSVFFRAAPGDSTVLPGATCTWEVTVPGHPTPGAANRHPHPLCLRTCCPRPTALGRTSLPLGPWWALWGQELCLT